MSDRIDMDELGVILEGLCPSSLAAHLDRDRPYDGQPHTDNGARGKQLVEGLTMRDVVDCYVRALYESSGLPIEQWPGTVYDLPPLDLMAVSQNLTCNIEKAMGIYPNVPKMECPHCKQRVTMLHPVACWACTFRPEST